MASPVCLAHNSAGPKMDIVVPVNEQPTGFLATTCEEYAESLHTILSMKETTRLELQVCQHSEHWYTMP